MVGAGGEIRVVVRGIAEDTADAGANIGEKLADHISQTSQRVIDSVDTVENADGASADGFSRIRPETGDLGNGASGDAVRAGAEKSRIEKLFGTLDSSAEESSSSDVDRSKWPDPKDRHPEDYVPSTDPPPHVDGPHDHPEDWLDELNNPKGTPGRRNNCAECSRSVDNTWHGQPTQPAAMANPRSGGESPISRMGDWAGQQPITSSMPEVQKQLEKLGPGGSAIVGCDWKTGGGHWFNAVNDGGTIKAVDGQSGRVEAWPPSKAGLRYDESMMRHSDAIFFGPDGKVVKQ